MDRLIRTYNVLNTEIWQPELAGVGHDVPHAITTSVRHLSAHL